MREEDLPPEVAADAPLAGKTVVVTGAIADPRSGEKVPRPTFQRLCERAGATTASSVSANTDLLITGANVGATKTAKAEKLGVEVKGPEQVRPSASEAGRAKTARGPTPAETTSGGKGRPRAGAGGGAAAGGERGTPRPSTTSGAPPAGRGGPPPPSRGSAGSP